MGAGSRWKGFRRRLRYWLDHSERQRRLREEMEFHIGSMTQELARKACPRRTLVLRLTESLAT